MEVIYINLIDRRRLKANFNTSRNSKISLIMNPKITPNKNILQHKFLKWSPLPTTIEIIWDNSTYFLLFEKEEYSLIDMHCRFISIMHVAAPYLNNNNLVKPRWILRFISLTYFGHGGFLFINWCLAAFGAWLEIFCKLNFWHDVKLCSISWLIHFINKQSY